MQALRSQSLFTQGSIDLVVVDRRVLELQVIAACFGLPQPFKVHPLDGGSCDAASPDPPRAPAETSRYMCDSRQP